MTVFARLTALLDEARVAYAVTRHAPVRTSEEAAKVRGTPLQSPVSCFGSMRRLPPKGTALPCPPSMRAWPKLA
jgi:hypothetical protein